MENKFREFWIELEEKGARAFVYTEPVDGLNDDAIHAVEYAALELANAEIAELKATVKSCMYVIDDNTDLQKQLRQVIDGVKSENKKLNDEIAKLEVCVARLKEENEALQQGISDMERAYDNVKDGLSKNICGYCEQSMNSDQNPSYEQLVVANDFNQQEIAKLKEENAQLSKYCGEVRYWQNRAEDLSEELERMKK